MQVREAEFLEIRQPGAQPGQVAGEQVDVAHAAEHLLRLEPRRVRLPAPVERLQVGRTGQGEAAGRFEDLFEVVEEIVAGAVEVVQQAKKPLEVGAEPVLDRLPFVGRRIPERHAQPGQDARQCKVGFLA